MPPAVSNSLAAKVARYYDGNTRFAFRFSEGADFEVVHRALWADGVETREQAFHYVDSLVLDQVRALEKRLASPLRVLDLGCGTGATLAYLARRASFDGLGVTLSRTQTERANERFRRAGLVRLACETKDYLDLPVADGSAHLVYAIESFVHGPDPRAFFDSVNRVLAPGGRLVLCDDFLSEGGASDRLERRERRWLEEFRHGWRIGTLLTRDATCRLAREVGFSLLSSRDLTLYIRMRRPRDKVISTVMGALRWLPYNAPFWLNLLGGNAHQLALYHGVLRYEIVVLEKAAV